MQSAPATNTCATPGCERPARNKYCEQPCAARGIAFRRAGFRSSDLTQTEWEYSTEMLFELEVTDGLIVTKEMVDDRVLLRRVDSQNPKWYSEFCSEYQRTKMRRHKRTGRAYPSRNTHKNHHTYIDRDCTMAALRHIVHDRLMVGEYGERLARFIRRKCDNQIPF